MGVIIIIIIIIIIVIIIIKMFLPTVCPSSVCSHRAFDTAINMISTHPFLLPCLSPLFAINLYFALPPEVASAIIFYLLAINDVG